ncbi:hypothetical protein [Persicitalea jodogahamensis]|uniref:Uncharacterized protein n=1 Tax=Persicitalea jodogahamensis TaxID=402147 RepID=A0A8J3D5T2_9BACT|nr:hypothetical protein [Persicitalea jodogahamensis]GHB64015.1 hypothetical protein GCM10007390_17370 [Persicitalea jodogahamensis]
MPGKFKNLSYVARGASNLGGIARLVGFAESDFNGGTGWPKREDTVTGEVTVVPPLKATVVGAEFTFDHGTCRVKSSKKGALGYQSHDHEVEAKFAGVSKESMLALDAFFNEGGVIVAYYKNGNRRVFGASWNPLVIEESDDSGAKGGDQNSISFKAKAMDLNFHAPFLATSVVLPTDATAVKAMPFTVPVA